MGPKNADARAQAEKGDISRTLLTHIQTNPKNFYRRLVIQDETWVHHFKPDSKQKQWKHSGSILSKKFKLAASVSKM